MKNTAKERTVSAAIKRAVCLALCLLMLTSLDKGTQPFVVCDG